MNEQMKMVEEVKEAIGTLKTLVHDLQGEIAKMEEILKHPAVAVQTLKPESKYPLTRKRVIDRAKKFVEAYTNTEYIRYRSMAVKVKLYVNAEKRTVTCILIGASTGKVRSRGFAKAAPQDVFNEHIGKAIAIQKALGMRVDERFMNAPQPKNSEIGDIVRDKNNPKAKTYTLDSRRPFFDGRYGRAFGVKGSTAWVGEDQIVIVDDTKGGIL